MMTMIIIIFYWYK